MASASASVERGRDLWTMQEIKSSLKRLARKHGDIETKEDKKSELRCKGGDRAEQQNLN